jgi:hypothetical protein
VRLRHPRGEDHLRPGHLTHWFARRQIVLRSGALTRHREEGS